jgi:hypothetical protein
LSSADKAAPVTKTASAVAMPAMVSLILFFITGTPMIELVDLLCRMMRQSTARGQLTFGIHPDGRKNNSVLNGDA